MIAPFHRRGACSSVKMKSVMQRVVFLKEVALGSARLEAFANQSGVLSRTNQRTRREARKGREQPGVLGYSRTHVRMSVHRRKLVPHLPNPILTCCPFRPDRYVIGRLYCARAFLA